MVTTTQLYPFFVEARKDIQENREAWLAQCAEDARNGFRPQFCIHGVYLWVDYDCVCWRCESDDRSELEQARDIAYARATREYDLEAFTALVNAIPEL